MRCHLGRREQPLSSVEVPSPKVCQVDKGSIVLVRFLLACHNLGSCGKRDSTGAMPSSD